MATRKTETNESENESETESSKAETSGSGNRAIEKPGVTKSGSAKSGSNEGGAEMGRLTRPSDLSCRMITEHRFTGSLRQRTDLPVFKIDRMASAMRPAPPGRVYFCLAIFVLGFTIIGIRMGEIAASTLPRHAVRLAEDSVHTQKAPGIKKTLGTERAAWERKTTVQTKTVVDVYSNSAKPAFAKTSFNTGLNASMTAPYRASGESPLAMPFTFSEDDSPSRPSKRQLFTGNERPSIVDRQGVTLAMNQTVTSLEINTSDVWDPTETAQRLAETIEGINVTRLAGRIKNKKNIVVKAALAPEEIKAAMMLGLPGLKFVDKLKRAYPQGALGAHLVGYTVPGRGGAMGLEKTLDETVKRAAEFGEKSLLTQQDSLRPGGPQDLLITNVDLLAQQILEEELAATRHHFEAKAAWGVIIDVRDGAVIAMASQPGFNPNALSNSPAHHRRNRAMYDRYELGSAFKAITAAAALEVGATNIDRYYDVSRPIQIADRVIGDFYKKYGQMRLPRILQTSSNIGIAHIARDLGIEQQQLFLRKLGLMDPLITDLPEKRAPAFPENWGPVEAATIAYGHGISVTALQLVAAFAAVINDGCFHQPYFIKKADNDAPLFKAQAGGRKIQLADETQNSLSRPGFDQIRRCARVFSPATTADMRLMLRKVVTEGTARAAEVPGYYPIGKTATADKISKTGGYQENTRISSFLGAFPGYNPSYAVLISFDEPKDRAAGLAATGSIVAAPVFARIVKRLAPSLGLYPATDEKAFEGFVVPLKAHLSPEPMPVAVSGASGLEIPGSIDQETLYTSSSRAALKTYIETRGDDDGEEKPLPLPVSDDAMTRLLRGITG